MKNNLKIKFRKILKLVIYIVLFALFSRFSLLSYAEYNNVSEISASSAIVINALTGSVVYEKNSLEQRAIASITKIMTALLTIEAGNLDKTFTVDPYAIRIEGTAMGLCAGDIVTRRDLCYGMMLPSGNDAANAAAVSVSGNVSNFIELMNRRAKNIGMANTSFANPHGLDASGHYSTARDMAMLTAEALKNPVFREICSKQSVQLNFGDPPYTRFLFNNNKMLRLYSGCIGVKTGFTDKARRCLVTAAERDGVTLIAVTLNAPDDWRDHAKMLDYGFSIVQNRPVNIDALDLRSETSKGGEKIPLKVESPVYLPLSEEEMKSVTIKSSLKPFVYSGCKIGEYAGDVLFYYNGSFFKKARLVTARDGIEKSDEIGFFGKIAKAFRKFI